MKENVLKKQFAEKDIQRIRNLVKGKNGEKISHGVGYIKETQDYTEGDMWVEDNRTWTIKDGIKQNITKLDKFKKVSVPIFCPGCKQVMDKQLDPFYYKSYGSCLDCRTVFETQLKIQGKWDDYVKETYNKEIDQTIEEYKVFIKEKLEESNQGTVTESGEVERWYGSINKERVEESLNEVITYLKSLKK
jgi:hypothetical protein